MNRPPAGIPQTWKDKDKNRVFQFAHAWAYQTTANGSAGPVGFVARFEDQGEKLIIPFFKPGDRPGQFKAGQAPDPRPLFGLETLPTAKTVFIVEGEKDATALHLLGWAAVSACGGSSAAGKADWGPILAPPSATPPTLVSWPDYDEPGRGYAATVWDLIEAAGSEGRARVVVELPSGTPDTKGAGAADWLQAAIAIHGESWDGLGPLPESIQGEVSVTAIKEPFHDRHIGATP